MRSYATAIGARAMKLMLRLLFADNPNSTKLDISVTIVIANMQYYLLDIILLNRYYLYRYY